MKSSKSSRIDKAVFKLDQNAPAVRVIKAAQAAKLMHPHGADDKGGAQLVPRPAPIVRMVASGADYSDLEIVCGCGEKVTVRCWNNSATPTT